MDLFFVVPALSAGFTVLAILLVLLILGVHAKGQSQRRLEARFRNAATPVVDRYLAGSSPLEEAVAALKTHLPAALALLLDRPETSHPGEKDRLRTLFRSLPGKEDQLAGLEDNDPDIRAQNAQLLGFTGDESTIPALAKVLDDGSPAVRLAAAHSLALLGHSRAVPSILQNPDFAGNMPAERVVEVLVQFGTGAIDPLLAALADAKIREQTLGMVVQSCGMLQAKPAVPHLLEILRHKNPEIRRIALEALASIGDPSAINPVSRLAEDPDPAVRGRVMATLGILKASDHIPLLVRTLDDPTWEIRLSAGRALYQMGDEGRKALEKTAAQTEDSRARGLSRQVLQTHGHVLPDGKDPR